MKKNIIFILLALFILTGCTKITPPKPAPGPDEPKEAPKLIGETPKPITPAISSTLKQRLADQSKIKKFSDYEEISEFMENNQNSGTYGFGYDSMTRSMEMNAVDGDFGIMEETFANEGVTASPMQKSVSDTAGMGGASDDYSKTNVQVEGVDEADIIKTDGKYIYAVSRNNLFIIEAYPAENANVLTKIEFKSRPSDIYINGDRLIVYGSDNVFMTTDLYRTFKRRNSYTFLKIFDITDRKNPKQIKDLDFEGTYVNSRMIGDYVYFVTSNYSYYIEDEIIIPRIIDDGTVINNCVSTEKCVLPDIYYFDMPYESYNFTSIAAINVKNPTEEIGNEVYLLNNNQNMYVSENNIYITYTKYISEYELSMEIMKEIVFPLLSAKNQDRIAKIEAADNFILNKNEKQNKIMSILIRYVESLSDEEQKKLEEEVNIAMKKKYTDISKELEKTVIHKIGISGADIKYKTFGEVTGQVLNQFSMDESNDGYFRIATTKNRTWSRFMEDKEEQKSYSNLYILDENLKLVGSLENLAPDERIYSVRFMQNRAYLVTFKQMDPLFVIDLKDPKNPKVLGELKIPGYSDYLHPYDDNTLIGLGKDTGETEWGGIRTKGLKLSLFDVSDVTNPKEIDTYVMGDSGSDSIALVDHKAFLFSRDKNLLSIPVSIREDIGNNRWGSLTFSGVAVFNVSKKGFELKGKIDHSEGGKSSVSDYWHGYNYYDNTVKRSLYIDDSLYTFSNNFIKINKLSDLELVNTVELKKNKKEKIDDFEIIN